MSSVGSRDRRHAGHLQRTGDTTDEEDRSRSVVDDEEEKRMIGSEDLRNLLDGVVDSGRRRVVGRPWLWRLRLHTSAWSRHKE